MGHPSPSGENRVDAGSIDGTVVQIQHVHGDVAFSTGPRAPRKPPPPGFSNLPEPPSPVFVGRDRLLDTLAERLGGPGADPLVVHGLGGSGKTSLALAYAHARLRDHSLVWWIQADSAERIGQGLAELARSVLGEEAAGASAPDAARLATDWLQANPGWLLVLDDVRRPEDLAPLAGRLRHAGNTLATSRFATGWPGTPIGLPPLDEDSAVRLLERRAPLAGADAPAEREAARALAAELGNLPLALEQAAAFTDQAGLSFTGYLGLLRGSPGQVYGTAAEGADPQRTVARTWRITLDHIAERDPLSVDVLRVLAWYAPEEIPRDLLDPLADPRADRFLPESPEQLLAQCLEAGLDRRDIPAGLRERMPAVLRGEVEPTTLRLAEDPLRLHRALALLGAYSMARLTPRSISVHRLVQAITRLPEEGDPHRAPALVSAARERAALLLDAAAPAAPDSDTGGWPRWRALLPHIDAYARAVPEGEEAEACTGLFEQTSYFLGAQELWSEALGYAARSALAAERLHGGDSPRTLYCREVLARTLSGAGRPAEAVELYEEIRAERDRVFGAPRDPVKAVTVHGNSWGGQAEAHLSLGQYDRAVELRERQLAAWEGYLDALFPGEHPPGGGGSDPRSRLEDTGGGRPFDGDGALFGLSLESRVLGARQALAEAYLAAGRVGHAIPLLERVRDDHLRLAGPDHRSTQHALHTLGVAYLQGGRAHEAVACLEETAEAAERLTGPEHPDTVSSLFFLAEACEAAGMPERCGVLRERTVELAERTAGIAPSLLHAFRDRLASEYERAGHYEQAIPLLERNLTGETAQDERTGLRYRLALGHLHAGGAARAAELFEEILAEALRLSPAEHERIADLHEMLAFAHGQAGGPEEAIRHGERAVALREGPARSAPLKRLTARRRLAAAHRAAGDPGGAVRVLEGVGGADAAPLLPEQGGEAEAGEQAFALARRELADALLEAGEAERAIPLLGWCLQRHSPEEGGPEAAVLLNSLGVAYLKAARPDLALPALEAAAHEMRAVFGEAHPSTLFALYNLASAAERTGDVSGAARLVAYGLAVAEREHGPDGEATALFRSFAADLQHTEEDGGALP